MTIIEGRIDIIPDIDWDTFEVKAGEYAPIQVDMFTEPISSTKSMLKTSMYISCELPLPQHKNVTHLNIAFSESNNTKDTELFRRYCRYNFLIGQKVYDYGPMSRFQWWNGKSSIDEMKYLAEALDLKYIGNEIDYRIGDNPIGHHILQGQTFRFELIFDDIQFCPIEDFQMVVFLKGFKAKSVC